MTATNILTPTGLPVAVGRHASIRTRSHVSFSEVRAARRARVLAAAAILTGIAAVSASAVAAIVLAVAA